MKKGQPDCSVEKAALLGKRGKKKKSNACQFREEGKNCERLGKVDY